MNDNSLIEQLKNLHFSDHEARVYAFLTTGGRSRAGRLIKHLQLHRQHIYTALKTLLARGLIKELEVRGVKEFEVGDPESLIEEQEKELKKSRLTAEMIRSRRLLAEQGVNLTKGLAGLEQRLSTLADESLDEPLFMLNDTPEHLKIVWQNFLNRLTKKSGRAFILNSKTDKNKETTRLKIKPNPLETEPPIWITTLKDRTVFTVPSREPISLLIEDKEIAEQARNFFAYLYTQDSTTATGSKAVEKYLLSFVKDLEQGQEFYFWGEMPEKDGLPDEIWRHFHEERLQRRLIMNSIIKANDRLYLEKTVKQSGDINLNLTKIIDTEILPPFTILIKDNSLLLLSFAGTPSIIEVRRPDTAQSALRFLEKLLYKQITDYAGWTAIKNQLFDSLQHDLGHAEYCYAFLPGLGDPKADPRFNELYTQFTALALEKGRKMQIILNESAREFAQKEQRRLGSAANQFEFRLTETLFSGTETFIFRERAVTIHVDEEPTGIFFQKKDLIEDWRRKFFAAFSRAKPI